MGALSRRAFLGRASVVTLALSRPLSPWTAQAAKPENINMRLGWLANAQYAGDFVALEKGWFKERGVELKIEPGGPSIDPISLTAGGSSTLGNVASIAALILARSNGLPVKAFGTALQRHPFAFITLDKSINSPKDFVGKKIGIQATARPLINAVIAKYQLPRDQVQVQVIGSDTLPLKTGQVDIITGWVIDAPQMAAVGPDARAFLLWDMGDPPLRLHLLHDGRGAEDAGRHAPGFPRRQREGVGVGGRSSRGGRRHRAEVRARSQARPRDRHLEARDAVPLVGQDQGERVGLDGAAGAGTTRSRSTPTWAC